MNAQVYGVAEATVALRAIIKAVGHPSDDDPFGTDDEIERRVNIAFTAPAVGAVVTNTFMVGCMEGGQGREYRLPSGEYISGSGTDWWAGKAEDRQTATRINPRAPAEVEAELQQA